MAWAGRHPMNTLFDEEIRGHHSMRDHVLTLVSDDDLTEQMPGSNPTLGELLVEMGDLQGVYTHSFATLTLDWSHRQLPAPAPLTVETLRAWFRAHDEAMKAALDRFTDDELHVGSIDRGGGFIASPFVQHQVYREAVYIFYGKLSVYLRALWLDAGPDWAAWIG
ncbi:DinB family protein [Desertihabitans aurantiacus]|uniref:DinB family protein n=1 Tax=Desertihabitans aurantiacus TaxID=2282477 RepID=UPI000DF765F1|nr:DinB family protein [Desertihabitans aurantiacus]